MSSLGRREENGERSLLWRFGHFPWASFVGVYRTSAVDSTHSPSANQSLHFAVAEGRESEEKPLFDVLSRWRAVTVGSSTPNFFTAAF